MSTVDASFVYKVALCEEVTSSCKGSLDGGCQEYDRLGIAQSLGKISSATTELVNDQIVISYSGGDTCSGSKLYSTKITFVCDKSQGGTGSLRYLTEGSCVIEFEWATLHACLRPVPSGAENKGGLSLGSILLIVSLVLVVVYLGAGMAYRFRFKEARGLEMLPNRAFWASLPGLIADGCKFTYHTIRSKVSGDGYSEMA